MVKGDSCTQFDSNMGVTFDFTDLQRAPDEPMYEVVDGDLPCTKNVVEQNFTYIFNICGVASSSPSLSANCKRISGFNEAGAIQVNERGTVGKDDDWCYLAGSASPASTSVKLLDADVPTKGVELTYAGSYCKGGKQRKFHVQLICADKLNAVPTHALELEPCVYTVTMPSVYGCPVECPVANRRLCGGNGHCAYDEDKGTARCFCNQGYSGSDCASTTQSESLNYSPAMLGLIITLFIIVGLLAGSIVFMVRQMNAYKEDLANYNVLKGNAEEDSAVV
eukprot:gene10476-11604_t